MGEFFPIIIVAIVMTAIVMKSRYRYLDKQSMMAPRDDGETRRLQDEVRQLKERIHVLERIAVDKEDTLTRQIEQLRDR